jgi:hypothetical protein
MFTTTYSTNKDFGNSGFYTFNMITPGFTPYPLQLDTGPPLEAGLRLPSRWTLPRNGTFVRPLAQIPTGVHKFRLECKVLPHEETDIGGPYPNDFATTTGGGMGDNGSRFQYGANALVSIKNFNIFEALLDT